MSERCRASVRVYLLMKNNGQLVGWSERCSLVFACYITQFEAVRIYIDEWVLGVMDALGALSRRVLGLPTG